MLFRSLANALAHVIHQTTIDRLFRTFTSICMLTAFLGVALCLMSFLSDGLKLARRGKQGVLLALITFVPPFILVLYFPDAYLQALSYAGILCVILLVILPAFMALSGRKKFHSLYQLPGGKLPLMLLIICGVGLIGISI